MRLLARCPSDKKPESLKAGLISCKAEFRIETNFGRSFPFLIAKPVVTAHLCNDILAAQVSIGDNRHCTH